mmetsp:Transcript_39878/g.76226  ORF Transcript_39878/g.76226 Transcript_39878/m.76226 type:complete len:273 (-) Transcript_39878:237-1055(-)
MLPPSNIHKIGAASAQGMTSRAPPVLVLLVLVCAARSTVAGTVEQHATYQACLAAPSTCTRLDFDNFGLSGTIPTELGALVELTVLRLSSNQFTGTIPSSLGTLTNLAYLNLFGNQLVGGIPSELGMLTMLTWLDIPLNQLTGSIPTEIGSLTMVHRMMLYKNKLTGSIPNELSALTGLTWLTLCDNAGLCGDVPGSVTPTASSWCPSATQGTILGSPCPTSAPTEHASKQTEDSQPLKENWYRKRDVAREKAFPQKRAWWRKQTKKESSDS